MTGLMCPRTSEVSKRKWKSSLSAFAIHGLLLMLPWLSGRIRSKPWSAKKARKPKMAAIHRCRPRLACVARAAVWSFLGSRCRHATRLWAMTTADSGAWACGWKKRGRGWQLRTLFQMASLTTLDFWCAETCVAVRHFHCHLLLACRPTRGAASRPLHLLELTLARDAPGQGVSLRPILAG